MDGFQENPDIGAIVDADCVDFVEILFFEFDGLCIFLRSSKNISRSRRPRANYRHKQARSEFRLR